MQKCHRGHVLRRSGRKGRKSGQFLDLARRFKRRPTRKEPGWRIAKFLSPSHQHLMGMDQVVTESEAGLGRWPVST